MDFLSFLLPYKLNLSLSFYRLFTVYQLSTGHLPNIYWIISIFSGAQKTLSAEITSYLESWQETIYYTLHFE
ncbi:hypothetical protein [Lyngbya aestuarii]|uniref:hypothetical protein n=1 Tax=Lyngbya aestuarii TaxID=118322 RepID=UPI00403DEB96